MNENMWIDYLPDAIYQLNDPKNEDAVMDIFEELDTDIIIEGEDPLYNAMKKLEDLGEKDIALHWIYPVYKSREEELKKVEVGESEE